jgi:GNAT superfamily N-acetyltransferase
MEKIVRIPCDERLPLKSQLTYEETSTAITILFVQTEWEWRCKGYTSQLVRELQKRAEEAGLSIIAIADNEKMRLFYHNRGFAENKTTPQPSGTIKYEMIWRP